MAKTGEAWIKSSGKRAFEKAIIGTASPIIGALVVPAMAGIAVSQKHSHVVHRTERSSRPGHAFLARKLGDPDKNGPIETLIRKAMVDELPQVIDIWRGSMALFGPRAGEPKHIERLFASIEDTELHEPWMEARAAQKPGIISTYANYSHAHNLEGLPEEDRFSEEESLRFNALIRATFDLQDFNQASLGYDARLLLATSRMAVGNYARYAQRFVPQPAAGL